MNWYAMKVKTNTEKSTENKLRIESETGDLVGIVEDILLPTEMKYSLKGAKRVSKEIILYPGYLFIKTNSPHEVQRFLRGININVSFLTDRGKSPKIIREDEINIMINFQGENMIKKEVENKFIKGEKVKILEGPFISFVGSVMYYDNQKVKVSISIFGRETELDLEIDKVEKI